MVLYLVGAAIYTFARNVFYDHELGEFRLVRAFWPSYFTCFGVNLFAKEYIPPPAPELPLYSEKTLEYIDSLKDITPAIVAPLALQYEEHARTDEHASPRYDAHSAMLMMEALPKLPTLEQRKGLTLQRYVDFKSSHNESFAEEIQDLIQPNRAVRDLQFAYTIPTDLRQEHMQVVAKTGHGKTQLFQSLILENLEEDAAIVVIDSQRDLINTLATRVPKDRLVLVDPKTCPPALNIFAKKPKGEQAINEALGMFEYIFSALEAKLTSKQSLLYRMIARLCLEIPYASLATMTDLLQPGGMEPYGEYIAKLSPSAQAFFKEFAVVKGNQYNETRQEVLRRVITVLEKETFAKMLTAGTNSINVPEMLDAGKVLLISTNKSLLKDAAPLFGRIFLAETVQAIMSRTSNRKRVYVYVDEFADYAEDTAILLDLFKQSRKYNCAMTIAHQELEDLTPKLASAIATNTSVKMVGKVSASDRNNLAREMRAKPETIDMVKKGEYLASMSGIGVFPYFVTFGVLEALPELQGLRSIQKQMRKKYGADKKYLSLPAPGSGDDFVEDEY